MAEETLLIKLEFDFSQPASSIKEVEKRVKDLTSTLKQIPAEGTPAFEKLAESISTDLGISITAAENKIRDFAKTAQVEVAKGKDSVSDFNKELKQLPSAGNSINAITSQVKLLEKEIKTLDTSTKEFADKSRELNKLKNDLKAIKQQAGVTGRSLTDLAGDVSKRFAGLNKILLSAFGFRAIGQGLRTLGTQFRSLVTEYKDSSEAIGQIDDDLNNLGDEIKKTAVAFIEANQEGISNFLNLLRETIPVLKDNASSILTLAAGLALYTARQQISNGLTIAGAIANRAYAVASGLLSGSIKLATVAQAAFNFVASLNPIGAIVVAITAAVLAYQYFFGATSKAANEVTNLELATKKANKAQQEIGEEFTKETKQLDALFGVIKDTNSSQEERRAAIEKLNKAYGKYLPNINLETASQKELEQAYIATAKAIALGIIERKRGEIASASRDTQLELLIKRQIALDELAKSQNNVNKSSINLIDDAQNFVKAASAATQYNKEVDITNKTIGVLANNADSFAETLAKSLNFDNLNKTLIEADGGLETSTDSIIEQLNKRKSALEENIKIAIALGVDYSKNLTELGKVTERLNGIQDKFNESTRFGESVIEALSRRQKELQESIKDSISTQQDYSSELEQLGVVTQQLTKFDKEYEAAIKSINDLTKEYADGSLEDYNKQISALTEQQSKLNLESEDYLRLTAEIEALENQRNFVLDLLVTKTTDFVNSQNQLNESLTQAILQEDATAIALARIQAVTDATGTGAEQIEAIEKELSQQFKQIELDRLRNRQVQIQSELQLLEQVKDKELEKVAGNEDLKLAVIQKFNAAKRELDLESSNLNIELLNAELANYKKVQEEKTKILTAEESRRQERAKQIIEGIAAIASKTLELISQTQTQAFEKQKEALAESEAAAIARAQQFGASEAAIQRIREEFAAKQEALERKQAGKQKALAITQALIDTSLLILKALATAPAPNLLAAGIAGTLGAIQIALIASRKFAFGGMFDNEPNAPQFGRGSYLGSGRSHAQGGMPIINPITGRKVAEIEKDEAIINKRSMLSNDVLNLSGTPYQIASALNSYKGYGVAFPKKFSSGGIAKRSIGGAKYKFGGQYGVSNNVIKLQSGAVFAGFNTEVQRLNQNSETNQLLGMVVNGLAILNNTTKTGFQETPTATQSLINIEKLRQDEAAAS